MGQNDVNGMWQFLTELVTSHPGLFLIVLFSVVIVAIIGIIYLPRTQIVSGMISRNKESEDVVDKKIKDIELMIEEIKKSVFTTREECLLKIGNIQSAIISIENLLKNVDNSLSKIRNDDSGFVSVKSKVESEIQSIKILLEEKVAGIGIKMSHIEILLNKMESILKDIEENIEQRRV